MMRSSRCFLFLILWSCHASIETGVGIRGASASASAVSASATSNTAPVCDPNAKDGNKCGGGGGDGSVHHSLGSFHHPNKPKPLPLFQCGLYMVPSWMTESGVLSLYTGIARTRGASFPSTLSSDLYQDLMVSLVDANTNEWSAWHDYVWRSDAVSGANLDNHYNHHIFLPGVPSLAYCVDGSDSDSSNYQIPNVIPVATMNTVDSLGVHRSQHASAGAFSYRYGNTYQVSLDLQAGQEIYASCSIATRTIEEKDKAKDDATAKASVLTSSDAPVVSLEWLNENAYCLDTLHVAPSTLPNIGRGAFSKRAVQVGDTIATSPVLVLDKSQFYQVEQRIQKKSIVPNMREEHDIEYNNSHVTGLQLLLNYAYGHPDANASNVLLLPLAPGVNAVNHHATKPNAYLRWSPVTRQRSSHLFEMTTHELLTQQGEPDAFLMEIAALRDIAPGEEVFLNYGPAWQEAWERHVQEYEQQQQASANNSKDYSSAADYSRAHPNELLLTLEEQVEKPYPVNLQTVCEFMPDLAAQRLIDEENESFSDDDDEVNHERSSEQLVVQWLPKYKNSNCKRPCDIVKRDNDNNNENDNGVYYTAILYDRLTNAGLDYCGQLSEDKGVYVSHLPASAVSLSDVAYTSDAFLPHAFRHEIGVRAEQFFPSAWNKRDPASHGDFVPTPLAPGELAVIRWAESGKVVTTNAYRLGLSPSVRQVLTEYCDKMGITEIFRHVTSRGNVLEPGTNTFLTIDGEQWYLQRPESQWNSNLQWLSPGDNPAHEHYLQALSVAGFDDMLSSIGRQLGWESAVAFHVTFIAVSHSSRGFMHYDVTKSGAKVYNIIIPLLLANETGPELDLQNEPDNYDFDENDPVAYNHAYRVGRYRYEYDVASLMGDDSYHASSACDYRTSGEMRMAATVYIADVNENNVDQILKEYTQAYPPDDRDLLLSWAGRHWKPNDQSVKLPKPDPNHILVKDKQKSSDDSRSSSNSATSVQ